MQLVCERDALVRELGRVAGVLERRTAMPILRCLHLETRASGRLMIRGTDLDMEISAPCEIELNEPGAACVDGPTLHELIKKCHSGLVSLTLEPERGILRVVSGRSRFTLPVMPPDEMPTLNGPATVERKAARQFVLMASELRALLGNTRFAVANAETRYYLNGVFLHQDGERLGAVATNGHMLSARFVPLPAGADGMAGVILGRKLVGELMRTLPGEGEVALEVSASRVAVTVAEVRIVSKLIDGKFPEYKRLVPTDPPNRAVVDRKRLAQAIERVAVVLESKGSHAVGLHFAAGGIEVWASSGNLGEAFDVLDALVEGAAVTIGANSRYWLDILGATDAENIVIGYTDHTAPILIHPDGEAADAHQVVLMPMRINQIMKEAA